jgi:hypothetical protein
MHPSALSAKLDRGLLDFAWDEWAQMGILAEPGRQSPWAQDPEALVVFTLEVARADPRLFDETLDWLLVNESLVNMRRIRAMCVGQEDELLHIGVIFWLDLHGRSKPVPSTKKSDPRPLFHALSTTISDPDPAFAAVGLMRPASVPTGKSGNPVMRSPINFAFRLRQLLGVNARAEVVRYLLTTAPAEAETAAITRSAGFASRNVRHALASLHDAGVVSRRGKRRFSIDLEGWAGLLRIDPGQLPRYQAWPQLLSGLRHVVRWLRAPRLDALSNYLLASEARDLLEEVRDRFEEAGFEVGNSPTAGAWGDLETLLEDVLAVLR